MQLVSGAQANGGDVEHNEVGLSLSPRRDGVRRDDNPMGEPSTQDREDLEGSFNAGWSAAIAALEAELVEASGGAREEEASREAAKEEQPAGETASPPMGAGVPGSTGSERARDAS